MKYYISENKLIIARTSDNIFFEYYDWTNKTWVLAQDLYKDIVLCHDWYDEVTEAEVKDAIASRTEPIYTYD